MIEYIKGDVTLAPEFVILQGCNAQGKMKLDTFATVKIGAGLGNGSWERIEGLINKVFPDYWVKIYVPE